MSHATVVHCKRDKYDVYIGRPLLPGTQIGICCFEFFGVVVEHAYCAITTVTKRSTEFACAVIMIPTQIIKGPAYFAVRQKKLLFRLAICLFIYFASLVGVRRAAPLSRSGFGGFRSAKNLYWPTYSANPCFLVLINIFQTMLPASRFGSGNECAMTQEAVIASNAKPASTQGFGAARRLTQFTR